MLLSRTTQLPFGQKNAIFHIASKAKPPETCKKFIENNVKNYLNIEERKTFLKRIREKVIQKFGKYMLNPVTLNSDA